MTPTTETKRHVVNIIPTYNEAENVLPMLRALAEVERDNPAFRFSTLVVDDRSPDGTGELVAGYARTHPEVTLLSKPREGLGRAMKAGYQHAIGELGADIVVTLDCDFQWNPADIPLLLEVIDQGNDVALASRHANGGSLRGWPLGRRITHWIANFFFATVVAGSWEVRDHNGNFRAIRVAGILDRIEWEANPVRGYAFFNALIYELSKLGARFREIPVGFRWRERGETKVGFSPKYLRTFVRDTLEYIGVCCRIRWERTLGAGRG